MRFGSKTTSLVAPSAACRDPARGTLQGGNDGCEAGTAPKPRSRLARVGMLAAVGLALSPTASAIPTCASSQTLSDFIADGACAIGDKIYTYLGHDFGSFPVASVLLQFSFFTLGTEEIHNLSVNPTPVALTGTYRLNYTIEITDPLKVFKSVSIDSDVPAAAPAVTFTKIVDRDADVGNGSVGTLISLSGSPSAVLNISPLELAKLWIYETVVVGANGAVNGFTDTYTQRRIPEPASLGLLGLGLIGLAAARRRKQ